jgi:predicted helicase
MLIQHILTEDIFTQVFNDGQYHRENNIAKELSKLEDAFFNGAVKRETLKAMQPYYAAIRANAAQITSHSEKQTFLKAIYEGFYKVYNPKAADRLGVVYTPNEIVRFMIEGADWLCHKHFGKNLIDQGVEILDPATGTGTFICEMLDYFRGQPDKLRHKYKEELHANEVAILPYYVANLNIEATYATVTGQYAEFSNLCFVDTLDNVAGLGVRRGMTPDLFASFSDENVERVNRQNRRKISVVIGNPPYNAWQENYNSRNPNRSYKKMDQRIHETYIKRGTSQNQNSVYDMYTRFFRWASDRIHDDGIVCFITGRKPFAKMAFDGFRAEIFDNFNEVYIIDLGGDVVDNPKLSGTKHNVFGIKVGVAISFLVRKQGQKGCKVFYTRRPEDDTAEDKLAWLGTQHLQNLRLDRLEPDSRHVWIDQTVNNWDEFLPMIDKGVKTGKRGAKTAIFKAFSSGLKTQRDEWVYDASPEALERKVRYLIATYEATRADLNHPDTDTIKWDRELDNYLRRSIKKEFDPASIRTAAFRPFITRHLYFDRHFNGMVYQLPSLFHDMTNPSVAFLGVASNNPLAVLAASKISDLCYLKAGNGGTQIVTRLRYTPTGEPIDNITDWALSSFTAHYGAAVTIAKDDIFHYVYGVLHDPIYRTTYAQNLKRDLPRIPLYPDFPQWAAWGKHLMGLHIGYEGVDPWPLIRTDRPDTKARAAGVAPKVILKSHPEDGSITLDSETTLTGIPKQAWDYRLGNRAGLEWVLDQHKEKTPKDPTIREKFNTYRFADHKEKVVDLIARVTRVSVDTMEIVAAMTAAKR